MIVLEQQVILRLKTEYRLALSEGSKGDTIESCALFGSGLCTPLGQIKYDTTRRPQELIPQNGRGFHLFTLARELKGQSIGSEVLKARNHLCVLQKGF